MGSLSGARESGRAVVEMFRHPGLRRLQLAWVGSILGTWAYFVALAVYAYGQGGAGAVALVSVLRMVPAAILAPFLATLADRFPRRLVMVVSDVVRAVLMLAAAAVIAGDGAAWIVYAIVTVSQIAGTPFSSARAALVPQLVRTPAELTATNVASGTLENVGSFLGPAIGGLVLAATNAEVVFALNGASFVWSAMLVLMIRVDERPPADEHEDEGGGHAVIAGFRAIFGDRNVVLLVVLYALQTVVAGALVVLMVVAALDVLHGGAKEVGFLDAATGIGGIIGSVVALALAARGRLAADLGIGLALFGAFVLVGIVPHLAAAVIALAVVGIGNCLVDIAAITLLQRAVPNEVLGRVVGVVEGVTLAALGIGSIAAPLLVDAFGARAAIIVVGAALPAVTVVSWPALRRLDLRLTEPPLAGLLRGVEIFEPLPPAALDRLARALTEVRFPAGTTVITKGEPGDRFYVVEDGVVEIEGNVFGPGSSFGEIALLRDIPRTATVTAHTDVILHALERDDFLAAVTVHEASSAAAESVIALRLGELRAGLTTEHGAA